MNDDYLYIVYRGKRIYETDDGYYIEPDKHLTFEKLERCVDFIDRLLDPEQLSPQN